jgi:hypothetical protein
MNAVPDIAFALVLMLASALSMLVSARARRSARDYLRFAAMSFAALACADLIAAIDGEIWSVQLAGTVALIVAALAPAMLAVAMACVFEGAIRPIITTPLLVLACLAGFASALSGEAFIAMAPLVASVCAMLALAARHWRLASNAPMQTCFAAVSLLAAAAAFSTGDSGRTAFALFCAVALLGAAIAATKPAGKSLHRAVEEKIPRFDMRVGRQS